MAAGAGNGNGNGFDNVLKLLLFVSHSGTASQRTRSLIRGLMPRSLTTSTLHPSSSCKSSQSPAWSRRLRPAYTSTRRSMSLISSSSPLATEPKTRTLPAPSFAAMRKISSRSARTYVNQKIDVALLPCLTTAPGAEDPDIGCSVPGCNLENLIPLGF